MPIVVLFIKTWWKQLVIVGALLAIWLYYHHLTSTIADQASQIATLTVANTTLQGNVDVLKQSIDVSNKSLQLLSKEADATKQGFNNLGNNIKGQSAQLDQKLKAILADKKPVTCDDTIKYLIDAALGYPR